MSKCKRYILNWLTLGDKKGIDTSDATATASDILKDKTAYVNGQKITGTLKVLNYQIESSGANKGSYGSSGFLATIKKITNLPIGENVTQLEYAFFGMSKLVEISIQDTSNITKMSNMFAGCGNLITAPLLNMQNVTDSSVMFGSNNNLLNVPVYNVPKVTNMNNMFINDKRLTNDSLDNILQMCISAVAYNGTKTLAELGINSSFNNFANIPNLPHYQDFLNAGWTIS